MCWVDMYHIILLALSQDFNKSLRYHQNGKEGRASYSQAVWCGYWFGIAPWTRQTSFSEMIIVQQDSTLAVARRLTQVGSSLHPAKVVSAAWISHQISTTDVILRRSIYPILSYIEIASNHKVKRSWRGCSWDLHRSQIGGVILIFGVFFKVARCWWVGRMADAPTCCSMSTCLFGNLGRNADLRTSPEQAPFWQYHKFGSRVKIRPQRRWHRDSLLVGSGGHAYNALYTHSDAPSLYIDTTRQ